MDGLGKSPQPAKSLGAFEAPKPAAVPGSSPSSAQAKPATDHVALNVGSGTTTEASKPVAIPKDVQWQQPVTAVQGKPSSAGGEKAVITYVGDGDSLSAKRGDGSTVNCRIDSIDAPEVAHSKVGKAGQPFGEESKRRLEEMVLNKEVTLKISRPAVAGKNYDRSLCQIEISGANIDKAMIKDGMAWLYRRYVNNPDLVAAENEARAAKRGLWADPKPVNPESFRRMQEYGR